MRILITGGFGFVGGRIAAHLAQAGHQVVLGSRNTTITPAWLPKAEVAKIEWNDDVSLERICDGVDIVIQAAGMNAQDCAADPVAALNCNGVATSRLLVNANRAGVKNFIYLSTAHVYANPLVGDITEETCPRNLHPYATSHLAGENAILGAKQYGKIQVAVLRLSNAFGVPMHKDVRCWALLTNDLCRQAVQTRKLVLQTNGLQKRDFIGLAEVCHAVEYIAVGTKAPLKTGVFNVGTGMSLSVIEMAQLIQQRSIQILGFEPILQCLENCTGEDSPELNYRTDKLATLGVYFDHMGNTAELDKLLRYSQQHFQ